MIAQVILRPMQMRDVPAVTAIEEASFAYPWTPRMVCAELAQELSWAVVAVWPGAGVVGFLIGRRYPDVWHVLDLAVTPSHRRRGVGTALLTSFLQAADKAGREVVLEVRPSNVEAVALYRSHGFVAVGVRRGYYAETGDDALVMVRAPRIVTGKAQQ